MRREQKHSIQKRSRLPLLLVMAALLIMAGRAFQVQVYEQAYWVAQGQSRYMRHVDIVAHRGVITDRHGDPLAMSMPVDSVWVNPRMFDKAGNGQQLAKVLHMPVTALQAKLDGKNQKRFVFIKRQVDPQTSVAIGGLNLPGVRLEREYKRFYPSNDITAHVLGRTNIDDAGQEGIELAFDQWLRGKKGVEKVIKDRDGNIIEHVAAVAAPQPGHELTLSLDKDFQYLTHKALKEAIEKHQAKAGTAVLMDVRSGEILAMANLPSFNPHVRKPFQQNWRNRAVTDMFEPGSTVKPFIVANALASGEFNASTLIDTSPGTMKVGNRKIRDIHDYGVIDLTTLLQKSSNVGASKIVLAMPSQITWRMFHTMGWGKSTGSGFPGEASGVLHHYTQWSEVDQATLAYGYGISTTALQLVRAYAALANDGVMMPVSLLRVNKRQSGRRIFPAPVARQVTRMLQTVVERGGTGWRARVKGYRIAGKTGTVRKNINGQYSHHDYMSLFAGFAPVSAPRLAMVVVIDTPRHGGYYGGVVAAPVFASVMRDALQRLKIRPDDLQGRDVQLANAVN